MQDKQAPYLPKVVPPLMDISIIPTKQKIPVKISKNNNVLRAIETLLANNVPAKCSVSQDKFPLKSVNLSYPDCKKVMARNNKTKSEARFSMGYFL